MSRPSTPAAPLLALTRFHACRRFSLANCLQQPDPVLSVSRRGLFASSLTRSRSALRSLRAATTAFADFSLRSSTSAFQPWGEISPGKNALLHCTTAGFTSLRLDHESFAESCPLALLSIAFYPVLVHRLAVSLHASSPHSVTLMQLRFASFAVINLRRDFHLQECARAGRTRKTG